MYFKEKSLDDILQVVLTELLKDRTMVTTSKGKSSEIDGVLIELDNPRARLSKTELKGTLFSCLGELMWYLSGSNDQAFIEYYLSKYGVYCDDGIAFGAYGTRLFNHRGHYNQLENVLDLLTRKPTTRQAVIQLFDANDLTVVKKDIPCTCTLQFLIRNNRLNLLVYMRSNDAYIGLPHDIFSFTMLQEIIACKLQLDVGPYKHMVGSLHLYESDHEPAKSYLDSGWQIIDEMPSMPLCDPFNFIPDVLKLENTIRTDFSNFDLNNIALPEYWADIVKLLYIFSVSKHNNHELTSQDAIHLMSHKNYAPFIKKKLR